MEGHWMNVRIIDKVSVLPFTWYYHAENVLRRGVACNTRALKEWENFSIKPVQAAATSLFGECADRSIWISNSTIPRGTSRMSAILIADSSPKKLRPFCNPLIELRVMPSRAASA